MQGRKTGPWGESLAASYLKKLGYKIIARNFRCKLGEIDIVAIKDGILIFVEVKTRLSKKFGSPEEAVTPIKVAKIARVGELFAKLHPGLPTARRIDVVAITKDEGKVKSMKIISAT